MSAIRLSEGVPEKQESSVVSKKEGCGVVPGMEDLSILPVKESFDDELPILEELTIDDGKGPSQHSQCSHHPPRMQDSCSFYNPQPPYTLPEGTQDAPPAYQLPPTPPPAYQLPPTYHHPQETVAVDLWCQVCGEHLSVRGACVDTKVVCPACGEKSPIAPPPAEMKYVRCICQNLMNVMLASTSVNCSRSICGRTIKIGALTTYPPGSGTTYPPGSGTFPVHNSSMLLTVVNDFCIFPCDVCFKMLKIPKNSTAKLVACSNCKEFMPPELGKKYIRCYCNCLYICSAKVKKVLCTRETCKLTVDTQVQNPLSGTKKIVHCPVCKATSTWLVKGDGRGIKCICGTLVPVAPPPRGKTYVYCSCKTLLVVPIEAKRVRCSAAHCRRAFDLQSEVAKKKKAIGINYMYIAK